ncbi:MAG: hypothetical protein HOD60_05455 [Candidatus Nitrosopelagicus sp.]|nr:hypothetical protein [Candidatus Nitrosopelagicus sp.]
MQRLHYTVIKDINAVDSSHNSSTSKQCKKVLGSLKIGETIEARQFVKETIPKFCKTVNPRNIANIGYRYLREGKKIGMLFENSIEKMNYNCFLIPF